MIANNKFYTLKKLVILVTNVIKGQRSYYVVLVDLNKY